MLGCVAPVRYYSNKQIRKTKFSALSESKTCVLILRAVKLLGDVSPRRAQYTRKICYMLPSGKK